MKQLVMALVLCFSVSAWGADVPTSLQRDTYGPWLESVGSVVSPYYDKIFDWYENQAQQPLPSQVASDPDHLFVSVDKPLQDTIEAENNGDVEQGVTYGLETYAVIDAPIDTVLETILFRWGKPLGQTEGVTFPYDAVFSFREEKLEVRWGPRAYRTVTKKRGGGVAKDQDDTNSLLVWGDSASGYVLAGQFLAPHGNTPSTSSMSIMTLKATADGRTEFRISGMYTGQSYSFFGIDYGRRNFGFNVDRIRSGQKDFLAMVAELKKTGKIGERKPALR